jgi:hypothetical protein
VSKLGRNVIGKNKNSGEIPLSTEAVKATAAAVAKSAEASAPTKAEAKTTKPKKDAPTPTNKNGKGSWTGHKYIFMIKNYWSPVKGAHAGYFDTARATVSCYENRQETRDLRPKFFMRDASGDFTIQLTLTKLREMAKDEEATKASAKEKKAEPIQVATPAVAEPVGSAVATTPVAETPATPAPVEISVEGPAPAVFTS